MPAPLSFVKKPCDQCPFRTDVKPFLHPKRAQEIAFSARNRFSDFPCHKTFNHVEEGEWEHDDRIEGINGNQPLTCAGFLSLRAHEGFQTPDGFEPSELCYTDTYEMIEAYEEAWNETKRKNK